MSKPITGSPAQRLAELIELELELELEPELYPPLSRQRRTKIAGLAEYANEFAEVRSHVDKLVNSDFVCSRCGSRDKGKPVEYARVETGDSPDLRPDFDYVDWLHKLPDRLDVAKEKDGSLLLSKKVLDQITEVLRAGVPYPYAYRWCNSCGHKDIAVMPPPKESNGP